MTAAGYPAILLDDDTYQGEPMDPNTTLARLRGLTHEYFNSDETVDSLDTLDEVVNLFAALDEWLAKGGFLPEAWAR